MKCFRNYLESRNHESMLIVLAPTGKAAVGVGGHTVWNGLGYSTQGPPAAGNAPSEPFLRKRQSWKECGTGFVVIDEIGLLGPSEIANVDVMTGRNTGREQSVFGNMHVIVSGDFTQKGATGRLRYRCISVVGGVLLSALWPICVLFRATIPRGCRPLISFAAMCWDALVPCVPPVAQIRPEPPGNPTVWRRNIVAAGKGYNPNKIMGTSMALKEARGRWLFDTFISKDVVMLVETKRFDKDLAWGEMLKRIQVGAGTTEDYNKLKTRVFSRLPKATQAKLVLAPFISSFNSEIQAYNQSTSVLTAEQRGHLVRR